MQPEAVGTFAEDVHIAHSGIVPDIPVRGWALVASDALVLDLVEEHHQRYLVLEESAFHHSEAAQMATGCRNRCASSC
jgi:hypothetical protein